MKTFSALILALALSVANALAQTSALGTLQQGAGQPQPGWHIPVSTPVATYIKTFTFQSGAYTYQSDAQASMQTAVARLDGAGYTVIESRRNGTTYTLVFMAPDNNEVKTYTSGTYTYYSDANEAMRAAVAGFEAGGRIVLEAARSGNSFRISYLERQGLYGQPPGSALLSFESQAFTYISDARDAMMSAEAELKAAGYAVAEARLRNNKYYLAFFGKPGDKIEHYTSGEYAYISSARDALAMAAAAFRSRGKVLLAASLHGNSFKISYIEREPNYWSGNAAFTRVLTFTSGSFPYISQVRDNMDAAREALTGAGYTVVEARPTSNNYTLVFIAPERAQVQKYVSGTYTYPSETRDAMAGAVAALRTNGKIVIEQLAMSNSFRISYVEVPAGLYPYFEISKMVTFVSAAYPYPAQARDGRDAAVETLRAAGYSVLEARLNNGTYTLVFIAPERAQVQSYVSGNYYYPSQVRDALAAAATALRSQGKLILESYAGSNEFKISYLEIAQAYYPPYPPYPGYPPPPQPGLN